jgi:hypothetical protein
MYNDTLLVEKKPTPRSESLRGVTYICELLCEFATICKNRLAC